jgi:TPR repeat protein
METHHRGLDAADAADALNPEPERTPRMRSNRSIRASLALALWAVAALGHGQTVNGSPIEVAHRAYHLGQFERSLTLYEQLAARGDAEAAERAGYMLLQGAPIYGSRVRHDPDRAVSLLQQAARGGRSHAQFMLGLLEASD